MNLNNFKLLKEDSETYHVAHPNGKSLVVSKKGLSEKAHAVIKKLSSQHLDEGGSVAGVSPEEAQKLQLFAQNELGNAPPPVVESAPPVSSPQAFGKEYLDSAPPTNSAVIPSTVNPLASDPMVQSKIGQEQLLNKEEQDTQAASTAEGAEGNAKAKAYGQYGDQMADMKTPQEIVQGYKAKDDALLQAYTDQKIDPDRYLKNMSTGSRITAGIGLLLSGFGSGASHQSNMALDNLNRSINEDIDAQKNDQGKTLNLYKMNQEALGNDLHAQLATQNQMWTGVQAKVLQATAAAQSPLAKARGAQLIDQIEQKKLDNRLRLGLLTQGQGQNGGLSTADPTQLVSTLVPETQQKQVFTELGQAQNAVANEKGLLERFDEAAKENTILRTGAGLVRTPPSILALNALADPLIHDNEGRINELEQKHVQGLFPAPGDFQSKVDAKRAALQEFINHKKTAPTAKGFGIDVNRFASTAGTPPAADIQTMGGVQYQKVAGGWKRVGS